MDDEVGEHRELCAYIEDSVAQNQYGKCRTRPTVMHAGEPFPRLTSGCRSLGVGPCIFPPSGVRISAVRAALLL